MPELTPQAEAQQIADLSRWILREQSMLEMLREASLDDREARFVMTAEAQ